MKLNLTPPRKPTFARASIVAVIGLVLLLTGFPTWGCVVALVGYGYLAAGNLRKGL